MMQSFQRNQGVPRLAALILGGLMLFGLMQPVSAAERTVLCEEFTNSM
jgi:hypothetical protein